MDINKYKEKARVPEDSLKVIKGGRLRGMSDIKPQWRIQALTEMFGLCGFGWYTKTTKEEIIEGSEGQKVAIVNLELYVKIDDVWSHAIPGTGGSMLVENETKGAYTSDEAFKMAHTDALSVACKAIGIASDIYMGRWDGSKYLDPPKAPEIEWLTEEQFQKALSSGIKGINATITHFSQAGRGIKENQKTALEKKLNDLKIQAAEILKN